MRLRRRALISLILPLLGACGELPTDSTLPNPPQYGLGSPRFQEADGSVPQIDGTMVTTFKLVGLGSNASTQVTGSADASGLWGCMTAVPGEFDLFPAPVIVSEAVSVSNVFPKKNGQMFGAFLMPAPAVPIQCLHTAHTLVPITSTFSNVRLSHPEAGTFNVPGLFDIQNYLILGVETVPSITSVVLDQTTFVIGSTIANYTVTINNPLTLRTDVAMQAWVRQGRTYRAAGGSLVICPGSPLGTLPGGDCTFSLGTGASNDPKTAGNGDLVAGPAVLELHLEAGARLRVLAGFTVPITLTN